MTAQTFPHILRHTGVMNGFVLFANENVNVEEPFHALACQAVVFGAPGANATKPAFTLLRRGSLRLVAPAPKRRLGPPGFEPGTKGL